MSQTLSQLSIVWLSVRTGTGSWFGRGWESHGKWRYIYILSFSYFIPIFIIVVTEEQISGIYKYLKVNQLQMLRAYRKTPKFKV